MNIISRAKNILLTPKTEWDVVAAEPSSSSEVMKYAFVLAAIPLVATILRTTMSDSMVYGSMFSSRYFYAMAVITYLLTIAGVKIAAMVVDALAPTFSSEKNTDRALKLVVYSSTPGWVAGILQISWSLAMIGGLISLYGIYLLYLGFPVMMKTPQEKVVGYMIVVFIVLVIVYVIIGALASMLTGAMFL